MTWTRRSSGICAASTGSRCSSYISPANGAGPLGLSPPSVTPTRSPKHHRTPTGGARDKFCPCSRAPNPAGTGAVRLGSIHRVSLARALRGTSSETAQFSTPVRPGERPEPTPSRRPPAARSSPRSHRSLQLSEPHRGSLLPRRVRVVVQGLDRLVDQRQARFPALHCGSEGRYHTTDGSERVLRRPGSDRHLAQTSGVRHRSSSCGNLSGNFSSAPV